MMELPNPDGLRCFPGCPHTSDEPNCSRLGMDDLGWSRPVDDPSRPERTPKQCKHPKHLRLTANGLTNCGSCGKFLDPAASRRGRTNRSRGNAIEREVGRALGLRRVGQYGSPTDLGAHDEMFAAQVKSGGAFPERFWRWLKDVPAGADQTPLLIVTDAPGPGHRRRAVVVLDLDDWRDLHGKEPA